MFTLPCFPGNTAKQMEKSVFFRLDFSICLAVLAVTFLGVENTIVQGLGGVLLKERRKNILRCF